MTSWILATDDRRVGGMLAVAQALGAPVTAVIVGERTLAETIAGWGFDRVLWCEPAAGVMAEAYAGQIAAAALAEAPRVVLSSNAATGRVLLGAVAARSGAAVIGALRGLALAGETIVATRSLADGKVVEDVVVPGLLAGIFDGDDVAVTAGPPVPVETLALSEPAAPVRLIETLEPEGSVGLLSATRVVGVGMGLRSKDDLKLIEDLAGALHAEVACTLPVCENVRWLPAERVVGSSHSQIAPGLYIAVGISGQPQHTSGIRDAKIIVAINTDPEARIFADCDYGIVGDLYTVIPALISAFTSAT